jgi:hypothetical protein
MDPIQCYPTQVPTLIGSAENMKLLFDDTMSDISHNRKSMIRHQDAWETLRLMQAQNAAIASHAINMNVVISAQTGDTDTQASVTPIRTAAADTENQQPAGAVYPPIRNVDQGAATATNVVQTAMAGVATAAEGIATASQSIADAVANLMNALTAVITVAAGNASSTSTPKS